MFLLAKDSILVLDASLPRCHCQVVGRQVFCQTVGENGFVMANVDGTQGGAVCAFSKVPDWVQGLISLS